MLVYWKVIATTPIVHLTFIILLRLRRDLFFHMSTWTPQGVQFTTIPLGNWRDCWVNGPTAGLLEQWEKKHLWDIIIPWFLLGFQVVGDAESLGTVSFTNLASKHLMVVSIYFNFTNRRAVVFLPFARSPLCKKICAQIKLRIIMQPPPVLQVWKTTIKKKTSEKPSSPIFFGI